jgi:CheY-like chemotaxis protein
MDMPTYVLMIQADEDDKLLTQSVLEEMQEIVPMLFIASPGGIEEVIATHGLPSVILINNQDHRHKAIDIVRHFKADNRLNHIPIVVLGELTTPDYIKQYYRAGANSYITKPSTLAATKKKIELFLAYWFDVAEV